MLRGRGIQTRWLSNLSRSVGDAMSADGRDTQILPAPSGGGGISSHDALPDQSSVKVSCLMCCSVGSAVVWYSAGISGCGEAGYPTVDYSPYQYSPVPGRDLFIYPRAPVIRP